MTGCNSDVIQVCLVLGPASSGDSGLLPYGPSLRPWISLRVVAWSVERATYCGTCVCVLVYNKGCGSLGNRYTDTLCPCVPRYSNTLPTMDSGRETSLGSLLHGGHLRTREPHGCATPSINLVDPIFWNPKGPPLWGSPRWVAAARDQTTPRLGSPVGAKGTGRRPCGSYIRMYAFPHQA